MYTVDRKPWVVRVILLGLVYLIVGLVFGALAASSASNHMHVVIWRLAAWVISGVVYAAHIGYEHFKLVNSPRSTALHAATAAAIGAFNLAVAANFHRLWVNSGNGRLLGSALVVWPALVAVPSFVIALIAAAGLNLKRRSAQ
jgi:hypothetical protein